MGCACNKGREATGANAASKRDAQAREAEARKQTATTRIGVAPKSPSMQGTTQSFSLRVGDKIASFGSKLERDAAAARTGGTPI